MQTKLLYIQFVKNAANPFVLVIEIMIAKSVD